MSDNDVNVAQVQNRQIRIEETGRSENIRDSCHAKTNHYIKQSRVFFPNRKLCIYIEWPYFIPLSALILFYAFGYIANVKEVPLGFSIACALFFIIYCQHEMVNQKSLPVILSQDVIKGQSKLNTFYEVTITELKGMALANYQAGIGFIKLTHGKIKFQTFNKRAIQEISRARCRSRAMLVLFSIATVYNLFCTVMALIINSR